MSTKEDQIPSPVHLLWRACVTIQTLLGELLGFLSSLLSFELPYSLSVLIFRSSFYLMLIDGLGSLPL
jgi:hypothetical protein